MDLYAKGQLSFLILTCLKERDFYGLDIISEISNRSNGKINLKKPSVYSNLTRMETQGYISSYLQSSDFGPNRKYYSLTENGRNFYKELQEYFDRNNLDPFRGLFDAEISPTKMTSSEISSNDQFFQNDLSNKNEDFFDFSSIEQPLSEKDIVNNETSTGQKTNDDYKYITDSTDSNSNFNNDSNSLETTNVVDNQSSEHEEKNFSIDEYNKRLYDISKDINKYKRKRSFAEDQIAISTTAPSTESQEKKQANIEEFKLSLLESRNKNNQRIDNLDFSRYLHSNKNSHKEETVEEIKNDAVFITDRLHATDFEKPKKIEPPKLRINQSELMKDARLPAPKRDLNIDPSHKEILSKLYSKSKDGTTHEVREDALYDFDDLKNYYSKQNIVFTEYKKSADKVEHNTTKLYLWVSLISFILATTFSALLFLILSQTNMVYSKTNFLYVLLPSLLILDVAFKFYNYKRYKGWLPSKMLPQWQIWIMYLISSAIIVGLNFICGMSIINFTYHATTIILPLVLSFILLPTRYYLKRLLIIKYWK